MKIVLEWDSEEEADLFLEKMTQKDGKREFKKIVRQFVKKQQEEQHDHSGSD